jgi:hypothetical protein
MAKPQVFNGVRDTCTILGTFFTEVSQEVGKERATELYGKYGDGFGEMIGNMIKEHQGEKKAAKKVAAQLGELFEGFGVGAKMEVSPTTILTHSHACPIYDGFQAAGLDHETIEAMCRSAAGCEAAALKRIVPDAELALTKFRATADDFCTEEIKLA